MAGRGVLVAVRLGGRSALIERFLQRVTDTIHELVATTEYLNFQAIEPLAIHDESGISLVAGTLHLGSSFCASLFDSFDGGFGHAIQDQSRSGLRQRINSQGHECNPALLRLQVEQRLA